MQEVSLTVPAPAGIGIMSIGVPEGSEIELDVRLESVIEGVLVSGTALVQLTGECSRCLDPISDELEVDLQELYVYEETDAARSPRRARADRGRRRTTSSATWSGTTSTSSRCCATRWCSTCRSHRCAGTTARGCARSAGSVSRTTRSTTTT